MVSRGNYLRKLGSEGVGRGRTCSYLCGFLNAGDVRTFICQWEDSIREEETDDVRVRGGHDRVLQQMRRKRRQSTEAASGTLGTALFGKGERWVGAQVGGPPGQWGQLGAEPPSSQAWGTMEPFLSLPSWKWPKCFTYIRINQCNFKILPFRNSRILAISYDQSNIGSFSPHNNYVSSIFHHQRG